MNQTLSLCGYLRTYPMAGQALTDRGRAMRYARQYHFPDPAGYRMQRVNSPSYTPFHGTAAMDNILLACTVGDIAWLKRCLSADPDHATSRNQEVKAAQLSERWLAA